MRLNWIAGDDSHRADIEAAVRGQTPTHLLSETRRRSVFRVDAQPPRDTLPPPPRVALVLKRFRPRDLPAALQWAKRATDQTGAAREWRALQALASSGIPAPRPLGWLRDEESEWIAMTFVEGAPSHEALRGADTRQRRAWIERLGQLIRRVHAEGICHGDLHLGNLLSDTSGQPILIDWQQARLRATARDRGRDLASLEFSFAYHGLGRACRLRLRRAALGAPHDTANLLTAGRRTEAFAHDYYRGRTRRSRTEGSGHTAVDDAMGRGMRSRALSLSALHEAIEAHDLALDRPRQETVLKSDERARVTRVTAGGRALVAKEVVKGGLGRKLADPLRGVPALRGWVGGHGLVARGIGVARPLAWVDRRGHGGYSLLLMEDVSDQPCLADAPREAIDPEAILRLLLALHRRGVDHGDLQASHIFGLEAPRLIDLEGIRFRRRLPDDARLRALAELNASLPDSTLPAFDRCALFQRYAAALPFRRPADAALREVVRRSHARQHAWRGTDCSLPGVRSRPR